MKSIDFNRWFEFNTYESLLSKKATFCVLIIPWKNLHYRQQWCRELLTIPFDNLNAASKFYTIRFNQCFLLSASRSCRSSTRRAATSDCCSLELLSFRTQHVVVVGWHIDWCSARFLRKISDWQPVHFIRWYPHVVSCFSNASYGTI